MRFLPLLASFLTVASHVPIKGSLVRLPMLSKSSFRKRSGPTLYAAQEWYIAALPTWWTPGEESTVALEELSGGQLEDPAVEWSFDDPHIQIIGDPTASWIQTKLEGYTGGPKNVIITCWFTPKGGERQRVQALMGISIPETEPPVVTEAPTEAIVITERPLVTEAPVITEPPADTEAASVTESPVVTEINSHFVTETAAITESPIGGECVLMTGIPRRHAVQAS